LVYPSARAPRLRRREHLDRPRQPGGLRRPPGDLRLARAARERGARAIEAYPITTKNALLEELHPGTEATFAAAGFTEVSRPTLRRAVVRIDFQGQSAVRQPR
jgi:hypothetical protein